MAAAGERRPDHAVVVDVDAARRVAVDVDLRVVERRLVDLGDAGLRIDTDDAPRHRPRHGAPHGAVGRVRDDAVDDAGRNPHARELAARTPEVLEHVTVEAARFDLAVAVDVVVRQAPALRGRFVAGLVEDSSVDPANRAAEHAVAVQRLVGVGRELHVVRIEADVDLMERLSPWVEVLHLAEARFLRRQRGGRMVAAEVRLILGPAKPRRHPDAAFCVHRRVIRDRGVEPVGLAAPVRRRPRHDLRLSRRRRRIEHRNPPLRRRVRVRVECQEPVVAPVDAVDRTVGVGAWVALVGRQLIVRERRGPAPLPQRQHEVAFDTLRARRHRRHLAGRDPIRPVRVHRQCGSAPESVDRADHRRAVLPDLRAVVPCVVRRLERAQARRKLACREIAELMADVAAGLDRVDPVVLSQHSRLDAVAVYARAGKLLDRSAARSASTNSSRDRPARRRARRARRRPAMRRLARAPCARAANRRARTRAPTRRSSPPADPEADNDLARRLRQSCEIWSGARPFRR